MRAIFETGADLGLVDCEKMQGREKSLGPDLLTCNYYGDWGDCKARGGHSGVYGPGRAGGLRRLSCTLDVLSLSW